MLFIGFLWQMVVDTYKRPSTCTWVMGNGKKQGFVGLDLPQHQDHPRWEKVKTKTFLFWVSVLTIRRLTVNFIYLHMCSAPRPSYQGCSAPDFDLNIALKACLSVSFQTGSYVLTPSDNDNTLVIKYLDSSILGKPVMWNYLFCFSTSMSTHSQLLT